MSIYDNIITAPVDVTSTTSNTQAVTSAASEENVVGVNLEDGKYNQHMHGMVDNAVTITGENTDAPPLLQGRLTIPTPVSLISALEQTRDVPADQSSDTAERGSSGDTGHNKDTVSVAVEECSGTFQNLHQSPVVVVCSTNPGATNTTESAPATGIANGSNPVAVTTPEPTTLTITSSFESSYHNKVTFAVPVLSQGMSVTTSNVTSFISQLYTKTSNNIDHSSITNDSFDGTYTNNSFDQSTGFSSENAVVMPGGTINCQLASSLTNDGIQPMDTSNEGSDGINTTESANDVVKKYICEHESCLKTYRYKKDVIRHMKMKHGSQPTRYEQKEVPEMLLRKHGCVQCDKMYAHRKDLLRHQRDVHSPEAIARREASKSNQKKYPCEQPNCNKFYVHKKDLIRHRRNDHNDFTDTKDMHIPEPVSPSQYSPSPVKRQRWSSGKVVSTKAETAAEPITASDVQQWLGVTVVKEGNVPAAVMATSDSNNTGTLASNCPLFNTSPSPSSSNAATSLLSLLNSASQQSLPVDTATAQLMGQAASVHPLFSAVTTNSQGAAPVVSNS